MKIRLTPKQKSPVKTISHAPRKTALEILVQRDDIAMDNKARSAMTVACDDAAHIPKVKNAGTLRRINNQEYQLMHNGLLMESGGYYGSWMSEIIKKLNGHHEPQEEKAFYELLKVVPPGSTMIELGSYWSYYSIWFNRKVKNAQNICCEPDPKNLELGKRNAAINKAENMHFVLSAAGSVDGTQIRFKPQEDDRPSLQVPIRTLDSLAKEYNLNKISIVHLDVQGAELEALHGAKQLIIAKKIQFLVVSTHHYSISGDALMHEKCLDFITQNSGYIIAEHAIHESFSGDGLIVATFSKSDSKLKIEFSENRLSENLFRPYTKDIDILISAYEDLRKSL